MAINQNKIKALAKRVEAKVIQEFKAQGHSINGYFESQMKYVIKVLTDQIIIQEFAPKYAPFVNKGVKAGKIPYNPNKRTGAKSSKYIEGLIAFVKARGMAQGKEAKSIAFAIAAKQKKEGMSTNRSKRFSKTGQRQGFIDEGLKKAERDILTLVTKFFKESINNEITNFIAIQ